MKKKIFLVYLIFSFLTTLCFPYEKRVIKVGIKKITVEIADTEEKRQIGLMERKYLGKDEGMLFIFERPGYYSFWMKNTFIPLSIAFISEDKKILEIKDMKPLDSATVHRPLYPIKYALEMNRSWFKKNKIRPGAKVIF